MASLMKPLTSLMPAAAAAVGVMGLLGPVTPGAVGQLDAAPAGVGLGEGGGRGGVVAIRAGRVMPVAEGSPWVIEDGVILIEDGVITAVGRADEVAIPAGARVYHEPRGVATPGLVAAWSGVAGEHGGEASISGAYNAGDAFDAFADYRPVLASGVTAAHLNPGGHRLVSGHGAVARMGGVGVSGVLIARSDLSVNLTERADNPPAKQQLLIPPSSAYEIEPAVRQRPAGAMERALAIREALAGSGETDAAGGAVGQDDWHLRSFRESWAQGTRLRVQAERAADLRRALAFMSASGREGYLVGGAEAAEAAAEIAGAGVGLVYAVEVARLDGPDADLGPGPDVVERELAGLASLGGLKLALAVPPEASLTQLRGAAVTAARAGLGERRALEAVTRTAAELIGAGDRIGSLEAGKHGDVVVFAGDPMESASGVLWAFVGGEPGYSADAASGEPGRDGVGRGGTVVVRGGTVWLGPGQELRDAEVLIEDGVIRSIGHRVARPRAARFVDAGEDGFVAPGLIDALGHLGLGGDRAATGTEHELTRLLGAADGPSLRVARSGVTTVVQAPYAYSRTGSRLSAAKTAGVTREDRVAESIAGVALSVVGDDPLTIADRLEGEIKKAEAYAKKWDEYGKALREWEGARAKGGEGAGGAGGDGGVVEEVVTEGGTGDAVTGIWQLTASGGPLPQSVSGPVSLRLRGNQVEGRVTAPEAAAIPHRIVGTFESGRLSGRIEVDAGPLGNPTFEATIADDRLTGTITVATFSFTVEGPRVDKTAQDFSVTVRSRRTTGKDGRPLPPPVDERLEPWRRVLSGEAALSVEAETAAEIEAVVSSVAEGRKLGLVLIGASDADALADRIRAAKVGVVVPRRLESPRRFAPYFQAGDLASRGVSIALGSRAEDGARLLPRLGVEAVSRGLGADAALAAMTVEAARMHRIDDRVGSIAVGRDGDLVIFSGRPFIEGAEVVAVIIDGREVPR